MKNFKKVLIMCLAMVVVAAVAIAGTIAYLTDTDSKTNVMVVGNVSIEQFEMERVFDANGDVTGMQEFTQGKPLYPAVVTNGSGNAAWQPNPAVDIYYKDYLGEDYPGGNGTWQNLNNVLDKFVFVKNTGKSDAYYRTIILLEADETGFKNEVNQGLIHLNINGHNNFDWSSAGGDINDQTLVVEVEGEKYYVLVATYNVPLTAGEISRPSLLQVGMDQMADNEHVAQFGDTYDILALSQAVQCAGFDSAEAALTEGFGAITEANVIAWFEEMLVAQRTVKATTPEEAIEAFENAQPGQIIDAEGVELDLTTADFLEIPGGVTVKGLKINSKYRGGNYVVLTGNPDETVVFENCDFGNADRNIYLCGEANGVNSVVNKNCTFRGPVLSNFVENPNGVAEFNNCLFTKGTTSFLNFTECMGGTHIFNNCTFDYTGVTQMNMGVIDSACVNVYSESEYSTAVILNGCTRINCKTRTYGSNSSLTVK